MAGTDWPFRPLFRSEGALHSVLAFGEDVVAPLGPAFGRVDVP